MGTLEKLLANCSPKMRQEIDEEVIELRRDIESSKVLSGKLIAPPEDEPTSGAAVSL
ncbi:Uncharacterised protein [Providencia rustigianii]|uniref:hypothetical protein n=1 Tax=Providencia rustigianii TaxID=158850 RepID=UPI000D8DF330|nr:Uncharacterised protein [Providencia rustigianii]VEB71787.1 Uncharacterised protein [Providencia rustigianii]